MENIYLCIQDSNYFDAGVHSIVEQVVRPKISQIQPEVENILYTMFGVEKADSNDEEMMEESTAKSEKLSNISSGLSNISCHKFLLLFYGSNESFSQLHLPTFTLQNTVDNAKQSNFDGIN